jgi:hypothetical protein
MQKARIGRLYFETIAEETAKIEDYVRAGQYDAAILQVGLVLSMQNEIVRLLSGSNNEKPVHKCDEQSVFAGR